MEDLAQELDVEGLGAEFIEIEKRGLQIEPEEFFRWMFTEFKGN